MLSTLEKMKEKYFKRFKRKLNVIKEYSETIDKISDFIKKIQKKN